jgi:hypothetical protein
MEGEEKKMGYVGLIRVPSIRGGTKTSVSSFQIYPNWVGYGRSLLVS